MNGLLNYQRLFSHCALLEDTRKVPAVRISKLFRGMCLFLFIGGIGLAMSGPALAQERHALVAELDGAINPVSQRFISRVIDKGEKEGAEVAILKLDTPGGLLSSTRKIVQDFLGDQVPTVVYVFPPGAQAASAGTFITASANFAVMAPGTNIGAAAPVSAGGGDIDETLESKVVQDTLALMRSIAEIRGRNSEALEDTITKPTPKSYDSEEAVKLNVVDFIAQDVPDLLRQIDGRTVETASGPRTLNTQGLALREINMNFIEKFLFFLADPNVAFLLLSLGGLGLVIELFNPGLMIPGVVGAILLLVAFVSLGNLPVNWAAVGFIILAGALALAEVYVSGFGVLGIGAIVSFFFGGLLLFNSFGTPSPTLAPTSVSLWLLVSTTGVFALAGIWVFLTIIQSRRAAGRVAPLPSPLIGAVGVVTTDLAPRGTVRVADEAWTAVTEDDIVIKIGEKVKVLKVEGVILTVARTEDQAV